MAQSLYSEYTATLFPQLVTAITERLNDKTNTELSYLFKQLLTPSYSADGRWSSIVAEYTRVAADIVSMDAALPVKARDVLSVATGDIPKMGMELYLTEKQMSDIDAMIAQGLSLNMVVDKIFADTPRVIEGVYERIEDMFLSGLSSGVALAQNTVGTGVRVSYGYKNANKFGVPTLWISNPTTATTISDIQRVIDKADEDGNRVTTIYADDTWLKAFYQSTQAKQAYAFEVGFVGSNVPNLGLTQATDFFARRYNINLVRVNRSVKTELNGVRNSHKPWQDGVAVFACDAVLGNLVWATLAETRRPIEGVTYQAADEYILVSKYSENRPSLREYTTSQARVVPVVNSIDRIYTLDCKTTQA